MTTNQSPARSWQINVVIVLLILLVGAVAANVIKNTQANEQQQHQLTQWEYKVGSVAEGEFIQMINKLGAEGWDIISTRRINMPGDSGAAGYEVILRRPANAPGPRY